MRQCPLCEIPLVEVDLHSQKVDRCKQCSGIYFDKGELEAIIDMISLFKGVSLGEEDIDTLTKVEKRRQFKCPVDGSFMAKQDFGGTIIDVCGECEGIWLDDQEITALRMTQEHIKKNLSLYIRLGQ